MNKTISIPSKLDSIKPVVEEVVNALKKSTSAGESDIFDIRLCLEETLINAIKYGNKFNEKLTVNLEVDSYPDRIVLKIEDKGRGFDYNNIPDPTREENLLKGSGRGIFLVNHLMDEVKFNTTGNRIIMTKYFRGHDNQK